MNVVERDATLDDAATIGAFLAERFAATFGHIYPPDDLAAFLEQSYAPGAIAAQLVKPGGADRIVTHRDALIAVLQIGPMGLPFGTPPEERAYELKRLYLADAAKGGGVADALMHWACARAVGFGARVMYLGVWSENVRAQRFYARHGFVKCGAYQFPVGGTLDDEWIMRRTL